MNALFGLLWVKPDKIKIELTLILKGDWTSWRKKFKGIKKGSLPKKTAFNFFNK